MGWRAKALIQNAIARLPQRVSYDLYYRVQRRFGGLKAPDPVATLRGGIAVWQRILRQGNDPRGKVFLEIGTGRSIVVPLAYWLMGAQSTITIDVNPYLKGELVLQDVAFIASHRALMRELFGPLLVEDRLSLLSQLSCMPDAGLEDVLALTGVRYLSPCDAAATGLPEGSIDFHTSYLVFEHIPRDLLAAIVAEGRRVLRPTGLCVHRIDYTDHFSHSDRRLSPIHFLKYSERMWRRIAGNRYMYQNRLRHDDYLEVFASAGVNVVEADADTDERARSALADGRQRLAEPFARKPLDVLAITGAWITGTPQPAA